MEISAQHTFNDTLGSVGRPEAKSMRALAATARLHVLSLAGFCAFMISVQVYDNVLLYSSVQAFNFSLFTSMGQVSALLVGGLVATALRREPSARLTAALALACGLCALARLLLQNEAANAAGAVVLGLLIGLLALCWGPQISHMSTRVAAAHVLGSMLASAVVCAIFFESAHALGLTCAVVPALASATIYVASCLRTQNADPHRSKPAAKKPANDATHAPHKEKSLLSASGFTPTYLASLAIGCLISSFFAGATLNPYGFQSTSIEGLMNWLALAGVVTMFVFSLVPRAPMIQPCFILAVVVLTAGMFLLSSGFLGSIVVPLGLILAARICFTALCWLTLTAIGHTCATHGLPRAAVTGLFGMGLALCNGTLGRSVGMLVSNHTSLSYPGIAFGATAVMGLLILLYAAFSLAPSKGNVAAGASKNNAAITPDTARALAQSPVDGNASKQGQQGVCPTTSQQATEHTWSEQRDKLLEHNLTEREFAVAQLILQGQTYLKISQQLDITERTVKYHARKIYEKTGASNRTDFVMRMFASNDLEPELLVPVTNAASARAQNPTANAASACASNPAATPASNAASSLLASESATTAACVSSDQTPPHLPNTHAKGGQAEGESYENDNPERRFFLFRR